VIMAPQEVDLRHLGKITHTHWHGVRGVDPAPLIVPPPPAGEILRRPHTLLARYAQSCWKFGFLRQLGWPLRALLAPMHWSINATSDIFYPLFIAVRRRFLSNK
jgi:hypothetical protein